MIDLGGYRVVVTGGSRGIGAACCRLFARAGAAVVVQYRAKEAAATALLAELHEISPGPHAGFRSHAGFRCDVSREEEVRELFAFVGERWGALDVLVNNAGIWLYDPLSTLDGRSLAETLAVNVVGPFLCVREALPLLSAAGDPSIINVGSTAGQRGEAFHSPYAASKGALGSATKSWAVELAPRVRVNAVAPGWVDTEMTAEALTGSGRTEAESDIPLGRIATAEDIAGPILFLASPLARHVTGEILNVNGGSVLAG